MLHYWFESENIRNDDLFNLIEDVKVSGIKCCLATDQERYRGEYMKSVMFGEMFDNYFISSDLGVTKKDPHFFELVVTKLQAEDAHIEPAKIVFFDDSESKVEAAEQAGLQAYLYEDVEQVRAILLD